MTTLPAATLKLRIVDLLRSGVLVDSQQSGAVFIKHIDAIEQACMSVYSSLPPPLTIPDVPVYTLAFLHEVRDGADADWWKMTSTISVVLDAARSMFIHATHVHLLRLSGNEAGPLFHTVMDRHADWWLIQTHHNAQQIDMFNLSTGFVDTSHELDSASRLATMFKQSVEDMSAALQAARQTLLHMLGQLIPTIASIVVLQNPSLIPSLLPVGRLCVFHRLNPTRQDVLKVMTKESCVVVQTNDGIYHKIYARGIPYYVDVLTKVATSSTPSNLTKQLSEPQDTVQPKQEDPVVTSVSDPNLTHNSEPHEPKELATYLDKDAVEPSQQNSITYRPGRRNTTMIRNVNDVDELDEASFPAASGVTDDNLSAQATAEEEQQQHQKENDAQIEVEKNNRASLYQMAARCLILTTDFARPAFREVVLKQRQNDIEHREAKIQEVAAYLGGHSDALMELRRNEEQFWQLNILPHLATTVSIQQYNKVLSRQTAFAAELRAVANEIAHA